MGLDTLEMIMGWEEAFSVSIPDDDAFTLRTPRMAMDLISEKLGTVDRPQQACLTLRTFNRLRASAASVAFVKRQSFHPAARLKDLATRDQ